MDKRHAGVSILLTFGESSQWRLMWYFYGN
ncbi:hypothetical protein C4J83_3575 [Pseudomonas sp. LBUM920]|jgi:hypothetical protein|nr:hypothetical protein C4J83_3575 [Pseudomonas sp. LBUM920]